MKVNNVVRGALVLSLLALGSLIMVAAGTGDSPKTDQAEMVSRGQYLVKLGGCGDCHSPKIFSEHGMEENPDLLLSGHPASEPVPEFPAAVLGPDKWGAVGSSSFTAWAGPWGVSFAANLTSDKKTGLGEWTEEQFIDSMRKGKHRGFGRPILPPMPWPNMAKVTDHDLKAMLAYFQSTKPISNKVPAPIPPK
jgi:mono/diheme cytochrome c family protein